MTNPTNHPWRPLEDLPANWATLRSSELEALAGVWSEQRVALEDQELLRVFQERLIRQWSIESGIIERVYTLDRGITQVLIERGIDASWIPRTSTDRDPSLVAAVIQDHQEAVEGIFQAVRGERALTTSFVKELHSVLMRNQPTSTAVNGLGRALEVKLLRGDYKRLPNNPKRPDGSIHEYCPPEQVASEMDRLIGLHQVHEEQLISPEVEAAWLHHRFTQIHPFQDGNGRVVRCLASLVFLKAGWFPLVVTRDDRTTYLDALEAADGGDLRAVVRLFTRLQKRAFVGALGLTREVLQGAKVSQVIESAKDRILRQEEVLRKEWSKARDLARSLQDFALQRLERLTKELQGKLGKLNKRYQFRVSNELPAGDKGHYYRFQIIEAARKLGYFADLASHRAWVSLLLQSDFRAEILLSFHGLGSHFRGVIAVSAVYFRKEPVGSEGQEIADLTVLSDEVFQLNYKDDSGALAGRFEPWLEEVLVRGLDAWQRGL